MVLASIRVIIDFFFLVFPIFIYRYLDTGDNYKSIANSFSLGNQRVPKIISEVAAAI